MSMLQYKEESLVHYKFTSNAMIKRSMALIIDKELNRHFDFWDFSHFESRDIFLICSMWNSLKLQQSLETVELWHFGKAECLTKVPIDLDGNKMKRMIVKLSRDGTKIFTKGAMADRDPTMTLCSLDISESIERSPPKKRRRKCADESVVPKQVMITQHSALWREASQAFYQVLAPLNYFEMFHQQSSHPDHTGIKATTLPGIDHSFLWISCNEGSGGTAVLHPSCPDADQGRHLATITRRGILTGHLCPKNDGTGHSEGCIWFFKI